MECSRRALTHQQSPGPGLFLAEAETLVRGPFPPQCVAAGSGFLLQRPGLWAQFRPFSSSRAWPQPFKPTLLFSVSEEVEQSKGEEAEAAGGASSHGCRLCQSGRSQQGDCPSQSFLFQLPLGFHFSFLWHHPVAALCHCQHTSLPACCGKGAHVPREMWVPVEAAAPLCGSLTVEGAWRNFC